MRLTARLAAALLVGVGVELGAVMAWADHPGALRSQSWSPLTAALVFGGLALLVGAIVVIVVTVFTRRDGASD